MKRKFCLLICQLIITVVVGGIIAPEFAVAQQQTISFNTFYNALSPFGSWVTNPVYGKVWVCNQPGFAPYYSGGQWAYTNAGWAWVSSYAWGWAPFHYGRWVFTNQWLWVPGYAWAPAWVNWRSGGGYFGWAPLAPGMGISVGFANYMPAERWVFCRSAFINSPNFANYCTAKRDNINIITNTNIVNYITEYNNTRFFAGPGAREVEKATGARITTLDVGSIANTGPTKLRSATGPTQSPDQAGGIKLIKGEATRRAVYNKNRPQPMQPHGSNQPQ